MKIAKLDKYRDIREDGMIFQKRDHPNGSKRAGEIWRPEVCPSSGRRSISVGGKSRHLSRAIWIAFNGPVPDGMHIDHKNGLRDDDRLENLRVLSCGENQCARMPSRGGSSKYRGVSWHKPHKKWIAQIQKNGKKHHCGLHNCETSAALARDLRAISLDWPKEGLNFPISAENQ